MTTSQDLLAQGKASPPSKDHTERAREEELVDGLFSALGEDRRRLRRVVNGILARLERTR